MEVISSETADAAIIRLEGKMMLGYEADDFHKAIKSGIEKKKPQIIVDLSEVKFISSWGIGILIHGYTTTINSGRTFKLASVPQKVNSVFRKVKIDTIFSQYSSIDEALKG